MPLLKKIEYDHLNPISMISTTKQKIEFGKKIKATLYKACLELQNRVNETANCNYDSQLEIDRLFELRSNYPDNQRFTSP